MYLFGESYAILARIMLEAHNPLAADKTHESIVIYIHIPVDFDFIRRLLAVSMMEAVGPPPALARIGGFGARRPYCPL